MKTKKHNPRSEAAQRKAIRLYKASKYQIRSYCLRLSDTIEAHLVDSRTGTVAAIFDLRDCYRKRAPLKGITKSLRKAIQPKRKK